MLFKLSLLEDYFQGRQQKMKRNKGQFSCTIGTASRLIGRFYPIKLSRIREVLAWPQPHSQGLLGFQDGGWLTIGWWLNGQPAAILKTEKTLEKRLALPVPVWFAVITTTQWTKPTVIDTYYIHALQTRFYHQTSFSWVQITLDVILSS